MKRNFVVCVLISFSFSLWSCLDDDETGDAQNLLNEQTAAIDAYLAAEGLDAVKDINGIRMVIYKLGTGFPAKASSTVDVDFVGRLLDDNTIFDQGTWTESVSGLIDGCQIALITLPEGSNATVFIPSYWGYGSTGQGQVPGDAILKFDLEFNNITRTSAELQRLASDTVAIDSYLASKSIVAEKDSTGLRYVITTAGNGATPGLYDKISYHVIYKLLTDDTNPVAEFNFEPNSSTDNRVVDQSADGLKQGLQLLREGGKATFYLPSILGFGSNGAEDNNNRTIIPTNANIIVEVELDDIAAP